VGEPFGLVARFDVADACFKSEDTLDEVHDLDKTPLEGSCDVLVHEESPSLGFDDSFIPNPLDHSHVFPMCSQPSLSPKYFIDTPIENPMILDFNIDLGCADNMFSILSGNVDDYVFLGYFRRYDPYIDPYCVCLGDLPKKITWTTCFNPFYDLSMGFDKVKRIPILFGVVFIVASYLLFSKLWSQGFDKFLHALTTSDLVSRVLKL